MEEQEEEEEGETFLLAIVLLVGTILASHSYLSSVIRWTNKKFSDLKMKAALGLQ